MFHRRETEQPICSVVNTEYIATSDVKKNSKRVLPR